MDHAPHLPGCVLEGHRLADDGLELRGGPEPLIREVGLEHPGLGGVQRQAEPLGVLLGFLAGLRQGQLLAFTAVDVDGETGQLGGLAGGVEAQLGLDLHPAGLAVREHDPHVERTA